MPRDPVEIVADRVERQALARRFDLVRIDRLYAKAQIKADEGTIEMHGDLRAQIVQRCVVSAEDVPADIATRVHLRFVPEADFAAILAGREAEDEDVGPGFEIESDDCDTLPYQGGTIDLGEAIAQTLALEIDPYPEGPNADKVRAELGLDRPEPTGPFAALKALKKD